MSNLTTKTIETTYASILNIGTEASPNSTLTSGLSTVTDGQGNSSSLSIATQNNGARITGPLTVAGTISAGNVRYTDTDGFAYQVLMTDGTGTTSFATISSGSLATLSPNPANTYTGSISSITVNNKGLVTGVSTGAYTPGSITWLTDAISLSVVNDGAWYAQVIPGIPSTTKSVIIQSIQQREIVTNGHYSQVFLKSSNASTLEFTLVYVYGVDGNVIPGYCEQGIYPVSIDGSQAVVYLNHWRSASVDSPPIIKVMGYVQ